ncbi:VOC family protein [Myxosarcina sp. GI1]|uniref:VOC family protein n=1 Tax=Myxosarcina sp. GI1 TaxID=1541065 RepID=UPI000565DC2A|nr:VOC family protein [Myxosarcina sp. GI1]
MKPNPVIWFEIYVQDIKRAKRFYENVFQVQLEKLENADEMWGFPMNMDSAGASGALVKMEGIKSGGSGTLPYFYCDDVAVELERVEPAGGQIYKPKSSIGEYGFIALILDTEGNTIGLHMSPKQM